MVLHLLAVSGIGGKEGILGTRIISERAFVIVKQTVGFYALKVGRNPGEKGAHVSRADLRPAAPDICRLPHLDPVSPPPPEVVHPVDARAIVGPP